MTADPAFFRRVALIGVGLIGSSLARVLRRHRLAETIAVSARTHATLDKARQLGLADITSTDPRAVVEDAALVVLCSPLGTYGDLAAALAPSLKARPFAIARYYVLTTASIAGGLWDWRRHGTEAGWDAAEGTRSFVEKRKPVFKGC